MMVYRKIKKEGMIMKHLFSILAVSFLLVFSVSCSEDELGDFQENDPEPEYRLFTMLDAYPALRSAVGSIDAYRFNDLMCNAMNDIPDDVKAILEGVESLLSDRNTDTLSSLRRVLNRVLYQDQIDLDPSVKTRDPGYAAKDFPYYDKLDSVIDPETEQKLNFTKPLLSMSRKMFSYLRYKFSDEELEQVVEDLTVHLRDGDSNVLKIFFEMMGKLYLQANDDIWHDEGGALCSRESIGTDNMSNTGIGNAVRGADASLSGQEEEMKNPAFREAYFNVLRESGKLMSSSINAGGEEKKFSVVTKELLCNLEKYFTRGGEVYESNDGNNHYQRGYINDSGDMIGDVNPATGKLEYVNAELGNTLREMFTILPQLWKRSDRPYSIANDDGSNDYFVDRWFDVLEYLDFDPDSAHIEEKMYEMFRYDAWGRDRLEMDTGDVASEPFAASFMQHMMLLTSAAVNCGWTKDNEYVGYMTIMDSLRNLGGKKLFGMLSLFDLCLQGTTMDRDHLFRCKNPFNASEKDDYKFWYDMNYPALSMLPAQIIGDGGTPWGGNPDGGEGATLNNYKAFTCDGNGEPDIIGLMMSMTVRCVWEGDGPYYSKENMEVNGNEYTYFRPDERINVIVTKPDPDNPDPTPGDPNSGDEWTYNYPYCGGTDVAWSPADTEYTAELEGQRKNNRYYEKVYTDYLMMHLEDITYSGSKRDVYVSPNEDEAYVDGGGLDYRVVNSGAASPADFEAGRMCMEQMIPERSIDRECDTKLETFYRNYQFFCADYKVGLAIPIYLNFSIAEIFGAMGFPDWMINLLVAFMPAFGDPMSQTAFFMMGECNGAVGFGTMKNFVASGAELGALDHVNGKWRYKRTPGGQLTGGNSRIPGDYRLNLMLVGDDVFPFIGFMGNAVYGGSMGLLEAAWEVLTGTADTTSSLLSLMLNYGFGNGTALGGAMSHAMPGFTRMAFLRCVDPSDPETRIDFIGSRKGELLKDEYGVVHPEWGFEANDSDPNWRNRNSFALEAFFPMFISLRQCRGPVMTKEEYYATKGATNVLAPTNTWCPSMGFMSILMTALATPLMYYQPGNDGAVPANSWMPRLLDDHNLTLSVHDVPGSSGDSSWEEKAYFQPANVMNLLGAMIDSDPFGDFNGTPKRCDSIIPLLTEYDVNRPLGPDNQPNTRLVTALFKMAISFRGPEFTTRSANYDENDFTTWSSRDKIRYGAEQLITSLKCSKGERIKSYEKMPARRDCWPETFLMPDWMFADNGLRPGDVDLDKIIDELIGSDESGKGLAIIPDNRPNPEDWNNFYMFFDAFGELLSNSGETGGRYNIMEDLIDLIYLFNLPEASDTELTGLRHTMGAVFTRYNRTSGEWEYPGEMLHIINDIVPDILESFRGRYASLCNLVDALLKEGGFVEYFIYTLDSEYSGREIFEQLYEFLGEDFIARQDSAFWKDFAELLSAFSSMIGQSNWSGDATFNTNRDVVGSANPFDGLGELLSW